MTPPAEEPLRLVIELVGGPWDGARRVWICVWQPPKAWDEPAHPGALRGRFARYQRDCKREGGPWRYVFKR